MSLYNTINIIAKANPNANANCGISIANKVSDKYSIMHNINYTNANVDWTYSSGDISFITNSAYVLTHTSYYGGN